MLETGLATLHFSGEAGILPGEAPRRQKLGVREPLGRPIGRNDETFGQLGRETQTY